MIPQMSPYTPSLYEPGSFGRFRQYPHTVVTPIPGAGYDVEDMFYGEQELNLDGSRTPQPYGCYSLVPLRGLGQSTPLYQPMMTFTPPPSVDSGNQPMIDMATREIAAAAAAAAAAQQAPAAEPEPSFLMKRVGPVPYWAVGLGALVALGGGGYFLMRRRKKVKPNRRRR